jgi:hypothetical protein
MQLQLMHGLQEHMHHQPHMQQQLHGQQEQPHINDIIDSVQILSAELSMDDLHVVNGINAILNMSDVWVFECAEHVENTVHGGDVGEESVAKALPLRCTPAKAAESLATVVMLERKAHLRHFRVACLQRRSDANSFAAASTLQYKLAVTSQHRGMVASPGWPSYDRSVQQAVVSPL